MSVRLKHLPRVHPIVLTPRQLNALPHLSPVWIHDESSLMPATFPSQNQTHQRTVHESLLQSFEPLQQHEPGTSLQWQNLSLFPPTKIHRAERRSSIGAPQTASTGRGLLRPPHPMMEVSPLVPPESARKLVFGCCGFLDQTGANAQRAACIYLEISHGEKARSRKQNISSALTDHSEHETLSGP